MKWDTRTPALVLLALLALWVALGREGLADAASSPIQAPTPTYDYPADCYTPTGDVWGDCVHRRREELTLTPEPTATPGSTFDSPVHPTPTVEPTPEPEQAPDVTWYDTGEWWMGKYPLWMSSAGEYCIPALEACTEG